MLDAHPELAIGPETQFVPELIDLARDGAGTDELVDAITGGAHLGRLRSRRRRRCASAPRGGDLAAVLRAFYGLYAEARGKPRWGEKTPGYVRRMRADRRRCSPRRGSST